MLSFYRQCDVKNQMSDRFVNGELLTTHYCQLILNLTIVYFDFILPINTMMDMGPLLNCWGEIFDK